jgi:hypothetical protein
MPKLFLFAGFAFALIALVLFFVLAFLRKPTGGESGTNPSRLVFGKLDITVPTMVAFALIGAFLMIFPFTDWYRGSLNQIAFAPAATPFAPETVERPGVTVTTIVTACPTGVSAWTDLGGDLADPCPAGCVRGGEVGDEIRAVGFPPRLQHRPSFQCYRAELVELPKPIEPAAPLPR